MRRATGSGHNGAEQPVQLRRQAGGRAGGHIAAGGQFDESACLHPPASLGRGQRASAGSGPPFVEHAGGAIEWAWPVGLRVRLKWLELVAGGCGVRPSRWLWCASRSRNRTCLVQLLVCRCAANNSSAPEVAPSEQRTSPKERQIRERERRCTALESWSENNVLNSGAQVIARSSLFNCSPASSGHERGLLFSPSIRTRAVYPFASEAQQRHQIDCQNSAESTAPNGRWLDRPNAR